MNKIFLCFMLVLLGGCRLTIDQPPPNDDQGWIKLNSAPEQIRSDMLSCGFDSPFFNPSMSMHQIITASLCMEKKGYVSRVLSKRNKKICDRYSEYKACGGSRLD